MNRSCVTWVRAGHLQRSSPSQGSHDISYLRPIRLSDWSYFYVSEMPSRLREPGIQPMYSAKIEPSNCYKAGGCAHTALVANIMFVDPHDGGSDKFKPADINIIKGPP